MKFNMLVAEPILAALLMLKVEPSETLCITDKL
jgi:hypothetical protein